MDAEIPQRKPVKTKTIGTILLTSMPIRVEASGFSAMALKARPTFVAFNKRESPATINIDRIKLTNWGIEIMNPPMRQSKLENGIENPRVSDPCATRIKYSKINIELNVQIDKEKFNCLVVEKPFFDPKKQIAA